MRRAVGTYVRSVVTNEWPQMRNGNDIDARQEWYGRHLRGVPYGRAEINRADRVLRRRAAATERRPLRPPKSDSNRSRWASDGHRRSHPVRQPCDSRLCSARRIDQLLVHVLGPAAIASVIALSLVVLVDLTYPFSGDFAIGPDSFKTGALEQFFHESARHKRDCRQCSPCTAQRPHTADRAWICRDERRSAAPAPRSPVHPGRGDRRQRATERVDEQRTGSGGVRHGPVEDLDAVPERVSVQVRILNHHDRILGKPVARLRERQHGVRGIRGKAVVPVPPIRHELTRRHVSDLALGTIGEVQPRRRQPQQRDSPPVTGHTRRGLHEQCFHVLKLLFADLAQILAPLSRRLARLGCYRLIPS